MAKKRTKLDIIESILTTLRDKNGRLKQTKLMYKANLSHTQMKLYLEDLFDKNMIIEEDIESYKFIILTDKGYQFIEDLNKIREFEKAFGV